MPPVLELRGITKAFPGVLANDHISFSLEKRHVHALLGENGAGKSTLMNILYGLYSPDEGEILINGEQVSITVPNDAIANGIGMVHQHFMLVPVLTVTENVMLGIEPMKGLFLDREKAAAKIREISSTYGLNVDPDAYIKDLPVGVQQRVEIIKLLYRKADILILDEPTAVLTPQEVKELFKIIRSLIDQGKSIIFITHKLNEVMEIADDISVLRTGRLIGTTKPDATTEKELAALMVGREVILQVKKGDAHPGDVILSIEDLYVVDARGNETVEGVSLEVFAGEVVGIAGVQGNGQTELVQAITGLRELSAGMISIMGTEVTHATPREILELGVGHIPEDRQQDGLVLNFPITNNMILNTYYQRPFAKGINLVNDEIIQTTKNGVKEYDVRTPSIDTPVKNLSGGNQQKVIVAREFSRPINLLVASQPTRGLDVGSIEYIHKRIIEKRDAGCAVLVVSAELDEILALSDRVAVMFEGKIIDIVNAGEASKEEIGLLMAGVKKGKGNG